MIYPANYYDAAAYLKYRLGDKKCRDTTWLMCMKQISEEEENPVTSSLNNCPEAFCGKGYLPC
jgi:hypothetical protein